MMFGRQPADEREMSEETKSSIIAQMEEMGSLEYTRAVLDGLFYSIWETVESIEDAMGPNIGFKALCKRLKL